VAAQEAISEDLNYAGFASASWPWKVCSLEYANPVGNYLINRAMFNDPIADLLTRIRNALMRGNKTVQAPSSKMLLSIADILLKEGFINGMNVIDTEPQKTLELELKYEDNMVSHKKRSAIRQLKRVSRPGVRKYIGYKDIRPVKNGLGISILSTPKGLLTGSQARKSQVGGEYLCEIW
jgi:small subunit ribosomal protein S8